MKNKRLRESYYQLYCVICGATPCDPAHVKTYATTLADHPRNLVPLCRYHHSEQHSIGIISFIEKHKAYENYIKHLGWEIIQGKLFNDGVNLTKEDNVSG